MTLALGIDPGTATTGFGLVRIERDGSLVAVKYGVFLTPKEATAPARLEMLYDDLKALLLEYKPEIAAVEKLFFHGCNFRFIFKEQGFQIIIEHFQTRRSGRLFGG